MKSSDRLTNFILRRISLIMLFMLIPALTFSQDFSSRVKIYQTLKSNNGRYTHRARMITNRIFREYKSFYFEDTISIPFKKFTYEVIPMLEFDQKLKEYRKGEDIFQYIRIPERPDFSGIFIYKDEEFIGTCFRTEMLPYSIMLAKEEPESLPSKVDLAKKISPYKNMVKFYVRGFLFTYWLVDENGDAFVYNSLDGKVYSYDEFIAENSPTAEIIKYILARYYFK
ncbi:MAG: hypothetical protein U0X39_05950 [Bacteroidales bacterium]